MEAAVSQFPRQLTLDAGGATVDSSEIGGIAFAAGTKDLEREFKKGADVEIRILARVVGIDVDDKYDAHGNVAETVRKHDLRVDEVEVVQVREGAFTLAGDWQENDDNDGADDDASEEV